MFRFVNMFGGSPLNRLSWLRTSHHFLNAIITLPESKWVLFNAGQPLVSSAPSSQLRLAYLSTTNVLPFLGPQPFFGQAQAVGAIVTDQATSNVTDAARHHPQSLRISFLGMYEKNEGEGASVLPTSEFSSATSAVEALKRLGGIPYFAMDVADLVSEGQFTEEEILKTLQKDAPDTYYWSEPRALMTGLDQFTAGVFACARSLADWNYRNKFCPGCGSKTYSMWGGWKLSCMTLLPWAEKTDKKPCPSGKGLHNYAHPRTDSVVIMLAVDETGEKIIMGRGKRFPDKFYSALAGFIEPGESLEDAVVREMWEEAGVRVSNLRYHSGQPWPYPANIMVGFYARADSAQPIRVDLDNELVDARWFTREEVLAVLNHTSFRSNKELSESFGDDKGDDPKKVLAEQAAVTADEPPFKMPPATAIAGVLIRDWAEGRIKFDRIQTANL
ncbi:hypothetical protein AGABI1DRAFT_112859 [Agaricus bisporus var. burnettii JB137-S8]|uniref:NAD(+) diphosphatase n=1 Tax=Agaricus bisporus var. burnettii (strain JB137-S8 / ATCC MYA-4627 / FGSC 10392) TaxID=597362 RepID=K5XCX5_AGABU|nr:uncharacterized protein AGABI1DRAFT_112859 [Agaricus bisporus var. burnettii JB137-S8]EKM81168.1 hypothetical protein AGABI1DRAFT_112859 [Agaricus bisporus var. burnettii JB137-S8]